MAKARPAAITKLSEANRTGLKNWMIYADAGIGKTVLAGTAPNALFLTVEAGGTESAREFGSDADEWTVNDWSTFQEAYTWLSEGGARTYDWVIVDSISEVEETCWRHYLGEQAQGNERRNEFRAELQDYNIVGNKMKRLADQFNRLPVNVLYTAHPMQVDVADPITEEDTTLLMPALGSSKNGKLSQKIAAQMGLVGYLTVRTPKKVEGEEDNEPYRQLRLAGNKRFMAKTRHHSLGRVVDRPTIPGMLATIEAAGK